MENYILKENETILFRGACILLPDGKRTKKEEERDVLLTNLNIVFMNNVKKLFKTVNEVDVYSVRDVKIYDETIQIIRRKSIVDIYLKSGELFVDFKKEKYAKEFCDKALRLISGFSKLVRSVKKTQKAINETNEALDVDVLDLAKKAALGGCEVVAAVGTAKTVSKSGSLVTRIASAIVSKTKPNDKQLLNDGYKEDNDAKQLSDASEKGE